MNTTAAVYPPARCTAISPPNVHASRCLSVPCHANSCRYHYGLLGPDSADDVDLLQRVRPFALTHASSAASATDMAGDVLAAGGGGRDVAAAGLSSRRDGGDDGLRGAHSRGHDGVLERKRAHHRDPVPHFLRPLHRASIVGVFRKDVDELLEELRKPLPPRPPSAPVLRPGR